MIPHFLFGKKKMLGDKHPNWGEIHSQKKKKKKKGRNSLSN